MANLNKNPTALTLMRRSRNITRTQLVDVSGVSYSTLEKWEQRVCNMLNSDIAHALAIISALDCELADILDEVPKVEPIQKNYTEEELKNFSTKTKLEKYRRAAGLTRTQLEKISGVNFKTIANFEQKKNNINNTTIGIVYSLATALNVSINDILENE